MDASDALTMPTLSDTVFDMGHVPARRTWMLTGGRGGVHGGVRGGVDDILGRKEGILGRGISGRGFNLGLHLDLLLDFLDFLLLALLLVILDTSLSIDSMESLSLLQLLPSS